MIKPRLLLEVTVVCTAITLNTPKFWVKVPAVGVGLFTAGLSLVSVASRKNWQHQQTCAWSDRYLILSKSLHSLEKSLVDREKQIQELDSIHSSGLATISQEREVHITNLNNQIDQLNELLEEQLAEIDQREQESIARIQAEVNEYRDTVEAELAAKQQQLGAIAGDDERWLETETQRLTQALEEDKAIFLEKHQQREDKLLDRIEFLEQELGALQWQLRNYEQPQLPEGVEQDAIAARRCIEILSSLGVTCDYRGSWLDTNYIYVRLRPRVGGIKQVAKWLDRLMIELSLAEKPQAELVPGAIQLFLRPRTFLSVEPDTVRPTPKPHPEVVEHEAMVASRTAEGIATLNASYLRDFVEPEVKHSINGTITQLETDWFNYLWNFHQPRPIRNQKAIIHRIWGKKSGDGAGFITARGRLHRIAQILRVELRRKNE